MSDPLITSRVVPSVAPSGQSPAQVRREFETLLQGGARLEAPGRLRRTPRRLLTLGYRPVHKLELFDVVYYLSAPRQNEDMRFFVAYVVLGAGGRRPRVHARIFYKDVSLTWRSASHYVRSDFENWLGKGDLRIEVVDGKELEFTNEATTDLPLEIQTALETLLREARRLPLDDEALGLVIRRSPDDRFEPYRDFTGPRRRAQADPRNLLNRGREIARFTRRNDPTSLRFARGFEPDFARGIVERSWSHSGLYGGRLRRFRVVSRNALAQYLFLAGPRQVWISSCQATTTEIMSYGVRTIDAPVDDDLTMPAYEYHFVDQDADPPMLHTQIPPGFAGPPSPRDPYRADTSPWLDRMPVIREFRRKVLRQRRRHA